MLSHEICVKFGIKFINHEPNATLYYPFQVILPDMTHMTPSCQVGNICLLDCHKQEIVDSTTHRILLPPIDKGANAYLKSFFLMAFAVSQSLTQDLAKAELAKYFYL